MSESIPSKRCSKCKIEKPLTPEYFHRQSKRTSDGYKAECKECSNAFQKHLLETTNLGEIKRLKQQERLSNPEYRNTRNDKRRKQYNEDHEYRQKLLDEQRRKRQRPKEIEARSKKKAQLRADPEYKAKERKYQQSERGRELNRQRGHRRRAKERGLPNTLTYEEFQCCKEYWGDRCCVCGRPADLWHSIVQEHWIAINDPRPDNPGNVATNILPMCHSLPGVGSGDAGCNNSKHDNDPLEWLTRKFGKRKATEIYQRILDYFDWIRSQ